MGTTKILRHPTPPSAINNDRSHRCFSRLEIQDDFFYVQLVNDIINKIFVSLVSTANSLGNLRLLDKEVISSSTNYGISMVKRGTETWYT